MLPITLTSQAMTLWFGNWIPNLGVSDSKTLQNDFKVTQTFTLPFQSNEYQKLLVVN